MASSRERHELLVPFLQVVLDLVGIEVSFVLSYWLRFYSPLTTVVPVFKGFPPFSAYLVSSWFVMALWILIFGALHAYGARRNVSIMSEVYLVFKGVSLGMLVVLAIAFFYRGFSYSRFVFVMIWVTSILFLALGRMCLIYYERYLHRGGRGLAHAAIVGSSRWGEEVFAKVSRNPGLGIRIVGYIGENQFLSGKTVCLGGIADIAGIIERESISSLFLALDEAESPQLLFLVTECSGMNVDLHLIPSLLDMMTSRVRVEEVGGIPVFKIKDAAMVGWNRVFKRLFDVLLSSVALTLLLPIFGLVALAVVLDSRGAVFYKQERVGMDGREFELVKFRTMSTNAEEKTGPVWASKGDPRVTRVGRLLRRLSLDELPQLWNVLLGDMSLVGPRPERPYFVEQFRKRIPKYLERHRMKSGMTGWAQVHGLRGNVPIEDRTRYDLYYVENWSLLLDLRILLMTVWAIVRGENAC